MTKDPLPDSLRNLIASIEETETLTPLRIKAAIVDAKVTPDDLMHWATFDHPTTDSYGRHLVWDGGSFEIMVMSWKPGDYSAIHDHGHTVWGAVQVFGPAEHAVFAADEERLVTVSRIRLSPGDVLPVGHRLVHQMGNPSDSRFMSLHVYGNGDRTNAITADSQVFDLTRGEVLRTDGGVFYSLPDEAITRREPCIAPNFHTWLFDSLQCIQRRRCAGQGIDDLLDQLADPARWELLASDLRSLIDDKGHVTDSRHWRWLRSVLTEAATFQAEFDGTASSADIWNTYASYYDHVIGTTNSYIPRYLKHVFERYDIKASEASFLDVGCGTGWLETELVGQLKMDPAKLLGVDPSPAMLSVARTRTTVRQAGLLEIGTGFDTVDVSFSNSFQYLPHQDLATAVQKLFAVTKPGGLCIGELISQDHIRWYPNVVFSEDGLVVSLRAPTLVEKNGFTYQESEIINVSRIDRLRVTHEGIHRRFVASPHRVGKIFRNTFGEDVRVFDAVSFEEIPEASQTCTSTRYVVCARRPTV
jgi:SAM-dependent methyltransferase/predicted metal-dependent enzyme (double-stranded beta helix superfamily)